MTRSKYDDLHDRFYALTSTKAGTRYERLAAVVFKSLEKSGTVIHDIKLLGESGVEHQIDVTIDRNGQPVRILVECKDLDISGDKVGLDIVRSFFAVVEDTKPDEAYVVTCNGFTADARTYARAKGIRLAVLRDFREGDWAGRIKTIIMNMTMVLHSPPNVAMNLASEADYTKHAADRAAAGLDARGTNLHDPVFFVRGDDRIRVNEFITKQMSYTVHTPPGPVEDVVDTTDLFLEVENRGPVKVQSVRISYDVLHASEELRIEAQKIATLLLQGAADEDVVIWDDDLRKFRIDPASHTVDGTA